MMLCAAALAGETKMPTGREWERLRTELAKQGIRVNWFAKTPAEVSREQADVTRQLERRDDPAKGASMRSIGGAAYAPARPAPAKSKPLNIGKLGEVRK